MSSLEQRLLSYLSAADYVPQDRSAIARGMELSSDERAPMRELLLRLESEKKLLRLRGARFVLAEAGQCSYTGVVQVLPQGKRLFVPSQEDAVRISRRFGVEDKLRIAIQRHRSMGSMEGDVVRARVLRSSPVCFRRRKKGPRPEQPEGLRLTAQVEEVLERRHELWVGALGMKGKRYCVLGDGGSAPKFIRLLSPPPPDAQVGMLVTVLPEAPATDRDAAGRISGVLGWPDDAGVDMAALIHRYALRDSFPEDVLQEMLRLPAEPRPEDKAGREDWTQRCVLTIDPATARDYDDAICVRRLPDAWELAVHIADVSHYVRPGSAADTEASRRGNSTYLPDRVLPMLPPRLCDELCSLVQGEDRLTLLCLIRFSPEGVPLHTRLARAVICSRLRLTYAQALALLEESTSTGDSEADAMLREAAQLARILRRRRMEAGALNLDTPEIRLLLNAQGRVTGIEKEGNDAAHHLIEEFMLAANEQVARLLRERALPAIFRVHEEPAPDKWGNFVHTLRSFGISASPSLSRPELIKIMQGIDAHADASQLRVAMLRAMMRARYAPKPLGHFGLAKSDYCHFTSPIRRYADLIVHRGVHLLIDQAAHAKGLPSVGQLGSIAEHLSETERRSAAAEAEALQLKLLQFMEDEAASDSPTAWPAIVCGVWRHGSAIDIPDLRLRAFLPNVILPEGSSLLVIPRSVDWNSQTIHFDPSPMVIDD